MTRIHLGTALALGVALVRPTAAPGATIGVLDFTLKAETEATVQILGQSNESGVRLVAMDGDFNGDGRLDPVVATNYLQVSPCVRVLWQDPLPAVASVDDSALGTEIVAATGVCGYLPDVNGDGCDELLISNGGAGVVGGLGSGNPDAFIVLGNPSPGAVLDLSSPSLPAGVTLIRTERGGPPFSSLPLSIAAVGDFSGDGVADLIVGDGAAGLNGVGRAYLILGTSNFPPTIALAALAPPAGFIIQGALDGEALGTDVQGRVNLNADALADAVVTGQSAYVVFGNTGPYQNPLPINTLGSAGITFVPPLSPGAAYGAASPGDLSGDGSPDLLLEQIGPPPRVHLIPANPSLSGSVDLTGQPNFVDSSAPNILRPARGRTSDLNNDRLPDLVVGSVAVGGVPRLSSALIVTNPLGAPSDLGSLSGRQAIRLTGAQASPSSDALGEGLGVADLDGDGFPDLAVSAPNADTANGPGTGALFIIPFVPPAVESAYVIDADNSGLADPAELAVVEFDQQVIATPSLIAPDYFRLSGAGDSFGTAGFGVLPLPFSDRRLALTLGAGADISVIGLTSDLDVSATGFVPEAVNSRLGVNATDRGVPDVDDAGVDVRFSMIQNSQVVNPATGGTVGVTADPVNAVYTQHAVSLGPGAVGEAARITLSTPASGEGIGSAVRIVIDEATAGDGQIQFLGDITLTMQYREQDFAAGSLGQREDQMRIAELVQSAPGSFEFQPLPGAQIVDTINNLITVTIPPSGISGFEPLSPRRRGVGPGGLAGTFATLPVETVDENRIWMIPSGLGSDGFGLLGADPPAQLVPGPNGVYLRHRLTFPGYVIDPVPDPSSIQAIIRTPTLGERSGPGPEQAFPAQSGAVFTVEMRDYYDNPITFTDPVDLEIQYIPRPETTTTDVVDFDGNPGTEYQMRACFSQQAGPPDFALIGPSFSQSTDVANDLVTVTAYTPLIAPSNSTGTAQFGAVVDLSAPPVTASAGWELYR